jgi:outer membrane protein assembly factor BamB
MLIVAGRDAVYGIDVAAGAIAWRHSFAQPACFASHRAGAVVIGGRAALCALDVITGAVRWHLPERTSALCVADDDVYAIGGRTSLRAVGAVDGSLRWSSTETLGEQWCALTTTDDLVVLLSGSVRAIARSDGTRVARVALGSEPALSADIVRAGDRLVGAGAQLAFALSIDEPDRVLWLSPLPAPPSAPYLAGDIACVSFASRADVIALRVTDGSTAWHAHLDSTSSGTLAVDADRVLVGSDAGVLRALRAPTGATEWATRTPCRRPVPTVGDDAIYAADKHACRVERDGTIAWGRSLPALASVAAVTSDHLVLASDGALLALDTATGSPAWTLRLPDVTLHARASVHAR